MSYITTRIALALLRGLRLFGLGMRHIGLFLQPALAPLGRILVRWLLLPIYRIFIIVRFRVTRWMISARGFFFLLLTNRYVFHTAIVIIMLGTISSQIQAKYATASEVGQHSLLYALVSDQTEQITEVSAEPSTMTKNSNYLGHETLISTPSIDYDYESDDTFADLTVPGSIAYQPGTDDLGEDEPVTTIPHNRTKTETYTVQSGDTIASISRRFGINVGTLLWANHLNSRALINPGLALRVPATSGVLVRIKSGDTIEKIAKKYAVDTEKIYEANRLTASHTLAIDDELILPGAIPLENSPTTIRSTVAVRSDVPISRIKNKTLDIYQEITKTKSDARLKPPDVRIDTNEPIGRKLATKLLWPTRLHVVNQYYGWKHTGIDLDGDYTDPIYASEDGVVEQAGWNNGGYGLMILIDHQNGLKTRYAHASKMFVNAGDTIKRGEVIAMVGTTGRSTGTHLHYEVYRGGRRQNPLAYIR